MLFREIDLSLAYVGSGDGEPMREELLGRRNAAAAAELEDARAGGERRGEAVNVRLARLSGPWGRPSEVFGGDGVVTVLDERLVGVRVGGPGSSAWPSVREWKPG